MWLFATIGALALAGGILVVRYMRMPRVIDLSVSALRFLPQLSPAKRDRVRWRVSAPLLSGLFWLRAAILALLLMTVLLDGTTFTAGIPARLGLRIVVDRSPSMGMGQPSRDAQATEVGVALAARAAALGGCVEVVSVPAADRADPVAGIGVSLTELRAAIAPAAATVDDDCSVTHAAVISDLPRPGGVFADAEGPAVLWFQVGKPEANTLIRNAKITQAATRMRPAVLSVEIDEVGLPQSERTLALQAADGSELAPLVPVVLSAPGRKSADYTLTEPGTYLAVLTDPEGLPLDDRLRITIGSLTALQIDVTNTVDDSMVRRLADLLGSPPAEGSAADLRIASIALDTEFSASGIYLFSGQAATPTTLDFFDETSPLLALVDIDLLETMQPLGVTAIPEGFRRVAIADSAVWLAVRGGDRPAVIMPAPPRDAGELAGELQRTWLVLFLNAFSMVAESKLTAAAVTYVTSDGSVLANVTYESNTAQPIGNSSRIEDIQPIGVVVDHARSLWPWLAVAALLLMCAERLLGKRTRWQS